jgi:hypothetical protein
MSPINNTHFACDSRHSSPLFLSHFMLMEVAVVPHYIISFKERERRKKTNCFAKSCEILNRKCRECPYPTIHFYYIIIILESEQQREKENFQKAIINLRHSISFNLWRVCRFTFYVRALISLSLHSCAAP